MSDEPRRLVNADVIRQQHELLVALTDRAPQKTSEIEVEIERKILAGKDPAPSWRVTLPQNFNQDELDRMVKAAVAAYRSINAELVP